MSTKLNVVAIFFCLFSPSYSSGSNTRISNEQKVSLLVKVWGVIKYNASVSMQKKIDWDSVFIEKYTEIKSVRKAEELDKILFSWASSMDLDNGNSNYEIVFDTTITSNTRYLRWLHDNTLLSEKTKAVITNIVKAKKKSNYFVKYTAPKSAVEFLHEKQNLPLHYPNEAERALSVARIWNMIEFFYPYKDILDKDWSDVLSEYILSVAQSQDSLEYYSIFSRFIAEIDDSHTHVNLNYYGGKLLSNKYKLPVICRFIQDSLVVTNYLDRQNRLDDGLQKGDILLSINNSSVPEIVALHSQILPHSNKATLLRDMWMNIGSPDSITKIEFLRNDSLLQKSVRMIRYDSLQRGSVLREMQRSTSLRINKAIEFVADSTLYINIGMLTRKNIDEILQKSRKANKVVMDFRYYPPWEARYYRKWVLYKLCSEFSLKQNPFAVETYPDIHQPGTFKKRYFYCGKKSRTGLEQRKIIVIINEDTQSLGEFAVMAVKTLPNVTLVGTPTAGADGSIMFLPCAYLFNSIKASGTGVYFPDGKATQRIGISPDVYVSPTIRGVLNNIDEQFETAINMKQHN